LTPALIQQALDRDKACIFSGVVPNLGVDTVVATWVFPPFLGYTVRKLFLMPLIVIYIIYGYKLSSDQLLELKYQEDPNACDLSEFMVAENVVSGLKGIVSLFWDNKIGVDVDVGIRRFAHYLTMSKYL